MILSKELLKGAVVHLLQLLRITEGQLRLRFGETSGQESPEIVTSNLPCLTVWIGQPIHHFCKLAPWNSFSDLTPFTKPEKGSAANNQGSYLFFARINLKMQRCSGLG